MNGGPSQFETFDPKPGAPTGGPTKSISTAVSGLKIAEHWPKVAAAMQDIALIRSMNNKEGAHPRAVYQLHTGYAPSGAVKYPSLGSVVAERLGQPESELPQFVSVGAGGGLANVSSGYLGMKYAPFAVANASQMPANTELPPGVTGDRLNRRMGLLKDLEQDFAEAGAAARVRDHQALQGNATQMILSPRLKAFDLNQEKESVRDRYGRSPFGQGCLLARRLVEHGVTFIEVGSTGWDTHQDNFERTKTLAGPTDQGFAALVGDLKERGLLEKTLVVWMGEFGRTPRVNPNTGRDHYPRAWTVALAGGGVQGGRVIGATTSDGSSIASRPVSVPDLFCTFCQVLNINPRKEYIGPNERPIKIVDGGTPVTELF
jgi:uncharacterized protein (DUF1501 family)